MNLDEGASVPSLMGACCSALIMITLIYYAYNKAEILVRKKDTNVLSMVHDLYYTDDDQFGYKEGFNVAVGFTASDSQIEWSLTKDYGELDFNSFSWGREEAGGFWTKR